MIGFLRVWLGAMCLAFAIMFVLPVLGVPFEHLPNALHTQYFLVAAVLLVVVALCLRAD